jgi:hypothetical protein
VPTTFGSVPRGCAGLTLLLAPGHTPPPVDPTIDPDTIRRLLAGIAPALGGLTLEPLALARTTCLVTPAQRGPADPRPPHRHHRTATTTHTRVNEVAGHT